MANERTIEPLPQEQCSQWLWATEEYPNQTLLVRCLVDLDKADDIRINISSCTRYILWIGSKYIGQGPCPAPWPECAVDTYKVPQGEIRHGILPISFIVHWYGVSTVSHPLGKPGWMINLDVLSNGSWRKVEVKPEFFRVYQQGGWIAQAARRSWATGWMENFDANQHPHGWHKPEFDDSDWDIPAVVNRDEINHFPRPTPYLKEWMQSPGKLVIAARTSADTSIGHEGAGLTKLLDEEPWDPLSEQELGALANQWQSKNTISVEGGERGLALCFDLGAACSGHPEFQLECSDGVVDCYGAESLRDGRPWAFKGNAEYANRWFGAPNADAFRPINYNGFRYLLVVLRPGSSTMTLRHLGVWRRQADLPDLPKFSGGDDNQKRLWEISLQTLRISTQETLVDCPTREQGLYIGDGIWNGLWLAKLWNEPSYLAYTLEAIAKSQHSNGLFTSAIFASMDPPQYLLDYCLAFIWGIDIYRNISGDHTLVKRLLPAVEKALSWFNEHTNEQQLISVDPIRIDQKPGGEFQVVFLDHPGVGWHHFPHPDIERDKLQLGLQAFWIIAIDAFQKSSNAVAYKPTTSFKTFDIDQLRQSCRETFFDEQNLHIADCVNTNGDRRGQSELSAALAILSGIVSPEEGRVMLQQMLAERHDGTISPSTPYSWIYLSQAMERCGMQSEILPLVAKDWGAMTRYPWTSTCWETFEYREETSLCHPWSALPAWLLSER
ncbi:hypothetical protein [Cerasicoccus fimbriatus]|uniref:alpha-L-rhamnosidase-related protein n=1 Tax=Cerasicoccus fimbriatus TaxID=3014554 RepID=UPI0022B54F8E|nr:hypothetical protein [Cerasicoccus sp. TK19100]